ncbi:hypothetical protein PRVXH_001201 [Proteinivorax hydrogeniformans]|uniref:Uncharacterized protein n=1 Tax=Proteinivorax hydrogeniformans TaxID=1826727 RepID=A0AAU8HWR1_9FIRM
MINKIYRRLKIIVIPTALALLVVFMIDSPNPVSVWNDDFIDRNQKPNKPYYYYLQIFNVNDSPLIIVNTRNKEHLIFLGGYDDLKSFNINLEEFSSIYIYKPQDLKKFDILTIGSHLTLSENSYIDVIDPNAIMIKANRLNFLVIGEEACLENLDMYHDFQFVISDSTELYPWSMDKFTLENFFYTGPVENSSTDETFIAVSQENYINIISDGSTLEIFQKNIK